MATYKQNEPRPHYDNKPFKRFVKKDGDDYVPKRYPTSPKRPPGYVPPVQKRCECGGKLKPRGSLGCVGQTSVKCTKCGKRITTKLYKGMAGLETFGYNVRGR